MKLGVFETNKDYWKSSIDRLNGISKKDKEIIERGQLSLFIGDEL